MASDIAASHYKWDARLRQRYRSDSGANTRLRNGRRSQLEPVGAGIAGNQDNCIGLSQQNGLSVTQERQPCVSPRSAGAFARRATAVLGDDAL